MPGLLKDNENEKIFIKVVGLDCVEQRFYMKLRTPLMKLCKRYTELVGEDSLQFKYNGHLIHSMDTAMSLGIEPEDEIIAHRIRNDS